MKSVLMTAALGHLLASSAPATAASFDQVERADVQGGAFAGARLRVPLGGAVRPRPQLALTFAPMLRSAHADGRVRMRFGEGLGFGIVGRSSMHLPLGGRASNITKQGGVIGKDNAAGVSTLGWVGIGAGALVLVYTVAYFTATSRFDEDDPS